MSDKLSKNKTIKAVSKSKTAFKKIIGILIWLFVAVLIIALGLNTFVCVSAKDNMYEPNEINGKQADCIMVLGCGVRGSEPSPMLKDRLDTAIELYKKGVAPKILMSGDHGGEYYNEVGVMKVYAIKMGVPSSDIFMDHAGFSTYESLYRAKELFGCEQLIAVTQRYHLYRTVYLGSSLGIGIKGVSTNDYNYGGAFYREIREILARDKDFFTALLQPDPIVPLGEKININGDGDLTNDEAFLSMAKNNNIKIN